MILLSDAILPTFASHLQLSLRVNVAVLGWWVEETRGKGLCSCVSLESGAPSRPSTGSLRKRGSSVEVLNSTNLVKVPDVIHVKALFAYSMLLSGALPIPRVPYYNVSTDDVLLADYARCQGTESTLLDCTLTPSSEGSPNDGYLVGVRCDGECVSTNNTVKVNLCFVICFSRSSCGE